MTQQLYTSLWGIQLAKSLQSCTTLCDPIEHGPPVSSAHGILQARILEWVAIWIEPTSLTSPALSGRFFTTSTTWETHWVYTLRKS